MGMVKQHMKRTAETPENDNGWGTDYFGIQEGFEFRIKNLKNAALILADYQWTHPFMEDYCEQVITECNKWLPDKE